MLLNISQELFFQKKYMVFFKNPQNKNFFYLKIVFSSIFFLLFVLKTKAQEYTMSNKTVTNCSGTLYDSGGANGTYGGNEVSTFTICPDSNPGCIRMSFNLFNTQLNSDFLYIYNGSSTTDPLIATFSGSLGGTVITDFVQASAGCMTLKFTSNATTNAAGWEATWYCSDAACAATSTFAPNNDCVNAFHLCSGGALNYNSNGAGIDEIQGNATLAGCLSVASGENQSAWYTIKMDELTPPNTPVGFTITPNGVSDYDFAVYKSTGGCGSLDSPIRCSSAELDQPTGLNTTSLETSEGTNGDGFVQEFLANANEVFYILIDNFSANNQGFELEWASNVEQYLKCSVCDFEVILEETPVGAVCSTEEIEIEVSIQGGSGSEQITWFVDKPGFTLSNPQPNILEATPPPNFSGMVTFSAQATDGACYNQVNTTIEIISVLPTPDITSSITETCVNQKAVITYTGNPPIPGITAVNFDFDGGSAVKISDNPLQYEVSWASAGTYTVSAQFLPDLPICMPAPSSVEISVKNKLQTPVLNCDPSSSGSAFFTWLTISGATQYQVISKINNNAPVTENPVNEGLFVKNGLNPDDQITIYVVAISANACNSDTAVVTCTIPNCVEPSNLGIMGFVAQYCSTDPAIQLVGTPLGGTFSGTGVSAAGLFTPAQASIGLNAITYSYTDAQSCVFTKSVDIEVSQMPNNQIVFTNDTTCINQNITFNYPDFANAENITWNFDSDATPATSNAFSNVQVKWSTAGTKNVSVTVQNGACSTVIAQSIVVKNPPTVPIVNCGVATPNSVQFNWTGTATNYTLTVTNAQGVTSTQTTTATTYVQGGLTNGETVSIVVTVKDAICGNVSSVSQSCSAGNCSESPTFNNFSQTDYCLNALPVTFSATPQGTITGAGVTDLGNGNYQFSPANAGLGNHIIQYQYTNTQTNCTYNLNKSVNVNPVPDVNFILPDTVCINTNISIDYVGGSPANFTYNWAFGGGATPPTATGADSKTVQYSSVGNKPVNLTIISDKNCTSQQTKIVVVQDFPPAPILSCTANTNSVTFSWSNVAGAINYALVIEKNGTFLENTTTTNLSYTVNNLQAGNEITLTLTPQFTDHPCGQMPSVQATCTAQACPNIAVIINSLPDSLCQNAAAINLTATPIGGTFTIQNQTVTTFNPQNYTVGKYIIAYNYVDTNTGCTYSSTDSIVIVPAPNLSINAPVNICVNEQVTVSYNGAILPANAVLNWNFGIDATPPTATGNSSHAVQWSTGGNKTIELTIGNVLGCQNLVVTQLVTVKAPAELVINCDNSQATSLTFSWTNLGTTYDYIITINGVAQPQASTTDTFFVQNNLQNTDIVQITIVPQALDCNFASASATCTPQGCSKQNFVFNNVDTLYCQNQNIVVMPTAIPAGGTFTFNNQNIDSGFNPSTFAEGNYTFAYHYEQGTCQYDTSFVVQIVANPTPTFTVANNDTTCFFIPLNFTYTGIEPATITFAWDFGQDASPQNSVNQNVNGVTWSSAGTKNVALTTTYKGCTATATTSITVLETLQAPVVICGATAQNSVTFEWDAVSGAQKYVFEIFINNVSQGFFETTNNNWVVNSGVQAGDAVKINIVSIGALSCTTSSSFSKTCNANDCPVINPEINGVPLLVCKNSANVIPTATPANGVFSIQDIPGTITEINPTDLNIGDYTLKYEYTENGCSYTATQNFKIIPLPVINFTTTADTTCVQEPLDFAFTGTALGNAIFDWDFGADAIPPTANTANPNGVVYNSAGQKTVFLTVENSTCQVDTSFNIQILEKLATPVAICLTDLDSLTVVWEKIPNAINYLVEVYNGIDLIGTNTAADTFYTQTGLILGTEVTIKVQALNPNFACQSSNIATSTCQVGCSQLPPPSIECVITTDNSITVGWSVVSGANQYGITILIENQPPFTQYLTDTSYIISGLAPDSSITFAVTAVGTQACQTSPPDSVTCTTQPVACQPLNPTFNNLPDSLCFNALPITLQGNFVNGVFYINNQTVTELDPKNYLPNEVLNIKYVVTQGNCTDSISKTVKILPVPQAAIKISNDSACIAQSVAIGFEGVITGENTFTWNFGAGNNAPANTNSVGAFDIMWSSAGAKNISLQITSQSGCVSNTATTTVQVFDTLSVALPITCSQADSTIVFTWYGNNNTTGYAIKVLVNNVSVLTNTITDTFVVQKATNNTDQITLILTPILKTDLVCATAKTTTQTCTATFFECEPINLTINNLKDLYCATDPVVTLQTTPSGAVFSGVGIVNNGTAFDPQLVLADSTVITAIYTTPQGCSDTLTQTVFVNQISAQLPATLTTDAGSSVTLPLEISNNFLLENMVYDWKPTTYLNCDTCLQPISTPTQNITYTVVATDTTTNCAAQATVQVMVTNLPVLPPAVLMPNAFSPNNDAVNDYLKPITNQVQALEWSIYNRWGELLFTTTNLNDQWDGTYKDQPCEVGVYVFYLKATFTDNTNKVLKGNVTIVK